jgi:beta-galactosidase
MMTKRFIISMESKRGQRWLRVFTVVLLLALCGSGLKSSRAADARVTYDFDAGWKMKVGEIIGAETTDFKDSDWKAVTLPHAFNEEDAFKKDIRDLSTGVVWYRKHFRLPAGSDNKKVFLEFEGIRHGGEFYLNGKFVGRHENGVMACGLDISDVVKTAPAENIVAVRVDNSWNYKEKATGSGYQWSDRNFYANYGGINKRVRLHLMDRLYQTLPLYSNLKTTGVYVFAKSFDIPKGSATVTAESEVRNDHTETHTVGYTVTVEDTDGKAIKTFRSAEQKIAPGETKTLSASAPVTGLHFWSWGYGYLYTVRTTLTVNGVPVDTVSTRTGFRKAEFANGVLRLNDRVLQLKGYAQRTTNEWPAVGIDVPPWMSDFSNRMMVESNANLVRWMHVTPSKQDVESCDRVGLLQAMPAGDSERDPEGRRWEQRNELMRDAIIYNRNNPSIFFYEAGNKGVSETHMKEMQAIHERYDPWGGRAMGSREMLGSPTAQWGGEMLYINKSATKPLWATEYSRDEASRKFWDDFSPPFHKDGEGPEHNGESAATYNRNQDSHAIENVIRWYDFWRERPGTGRRVSAGGVNIIFSDSNTHHRGAENYRRSGEVDAMRLPKDGYYAHQVMWDGWVDVEKPRLHIVGHWNYAPGTKKTVYVISSAEKVDLFVNNRKIGSGEQSYRFLFTFKNVACQPGEIRAVGYSTSGKATCKETIQTAGAPAALRLTSRTGPGGLRADGSDMAMVDVEVVDAQGRRCPTALSPVSFALTGPAEWRGGIAQGPDNYILAQTLPVECGINRVLVRSTTRAGNISLTATAEGLKPATVELTSRPVTVTEGLSALGATLASNLERGPTPRGDSVTITRTPITIMKAEAGANADKVALTYDDNEETSWSNDGSRATAWIRYDFARPTAVKEVTLKLSNWRNRSYPIRILVGDKVVFTGQTPRSLGYVTLTFPVTTGPNLKIELTANAKSGDAFGNIVEVTGKKDIPKASAKTAEKGTLSIIEAEIYDPSPIKGGKGGTAHTRSTSRG